MVKHEEGKIGEEGGGSSRCGSELSYTMRPCDSGLDS